MPCTNPFPEYHGNVNTGKTHLPTYHHNYIQPDHSLIYVEAQHPESPHWIHVQTAAWLYIIENILQKLYYIHIAEIPPAYFWL